MTQPRRMRAKDHLAATIRAHREGEERLAEMDKTWVSHGSLCCPGCMFGMPWHRLVKKQERRESRIEQLEKKIKRDSR